jgi:uncharacterized protein
MSTFLNTLGNTLGTVLAAARRSRQPTWQRLGLTAGAAAQPKTVLITGATGFIGRRLAYRLIARGDRVIVHARRPARAADLFGPHAELFVSLTDVPSELRVDAIVNLAGESIAGGLWTERRKARLLESRVAVTESLLALVARLAVKPRTWVNASAVGYYGVRNGPEALHEKTAPQPIFQSELCRLWELAAARAAEHGVKVAALRIGLVLGAGGGALPALARPVRLGLGMRFGRGAQWVSWIHIDDLLELILFVLGQETLAGPLNATAPTPVTHAELMAALAKTLHRRLLPIAIPARVLRALLGELAQLVVDGQRVTPERATALGFEFRYPAVETALAAALADEAAARGERGKDAELLSSASSPPGSATV